MSDKNECGITIMMSKTIELLINDFLPVTEIILERLNLPRIEV